MLPPSPRFASHLASLRLEPGRAIVAVSGGGDSMALLDLLLATTATHELELMVGHVDHGIHPASREVADRVEGLAREAGLAVEVGRLDLGPERQRDDRSHRALCFSSRSAGETRCPLHRHRAPRR